MNITGAEFTLAFHRAHARLRLALGEALAVHHGMDYDDFAVLHALAEEPGLGLTELGSQLGVSRTLVLQRIRPLEKVGLVRAEGKLADRRLSLTRAGERTLASATGSVAEVCDDALRLSVMGTLGQQ